MNEIVQNSPIHGQTSADTDDHDDPFGVGKWCWVSDTDRDDKPTKWLGCVLSHGSNYVLLQGVRIEEYSYYEERIHVSKLYERLTPETDAEVVIAKQIAFHQDRVNRLLGRIKEETAKLGIVPKTAIADASAPGDNALAVVTQQVDTTAYKKALVKAKEEDLPALFKEVEAEHKRLAGWMKAPILPMQAKIGPMKDSIAQIDDRIYTVELYAGLTEFAEKVRDGDPAMSDAPLHVMQRKLYMDEECLLDYDAGGMEFKDIRAFTEWVARPQNFDRMLPFQRCVAAFQVRRNVKERHASDLRGLIEMHFKEQEDKYTYLLVRNGEQIWFVGCDFEFDDKLFPDQTEFDPVNGGFMMETCAGSVKKIITRNEYEVTIAQYEEKLARWESNNPDPTDRERWNMPNHPYRNDNMEPMDPSSVYFDDGMKLVDGKVRAYNRIAVILQGLFDRSLALHPHPPVSVWDNASFERSVKLIYDATALTHGDAPDYETYRAKLAESLTEGSVTLGQMRVFGERELERENKRRENNWRQQEKPIYAETFYPYGDPGPGKIATIAEWKPRAKKAVYRWTRESRNYSARYWDRPDEVNCSITVEADRLFNVSAYQPGDYLQFFRDPRTRADYLKWAPTLLAAENYHARKEKAE